MALYREQGIEFLIKALESPEYLEEVSGLKKMKMESEEVDVEWDDGDEDEDGW